MLEDTIKILFIFILIAATFIITRKDILSIITAYSIQSFLISLLAAVLYLGSGNKVLVILASLTFASKVLLIPAFMKRIQKRIKIKRDVDFNYFSPTTALALSLLMILTGYTFLSHTLKAFSLSSTFVFGTVVGISLMLMGLMVIFNRKQAITNIVGYLTMENGVLIMSLFITELPLLIEVLILVDLISLILLSTILSFGINADIEEFTEHFANPLAWLKGDEE